MGQRVKALLRRREVTYQDVADLASVSWQMVYLVVNGKRKSAKVTAAIRKLTGQDGDGTR